LVSGGERIRVLVVDDDDLLAGALDALIASEPGLEHVGRARTGEEGVALAAALRPDVVVMDVEMPGMGGLEATRLIAAGGSGAAVLVTTGADVEAHVHSARAAGAAGYLPKSDLHDRLLPTIRAIARPPA
jgi:DNA-binding NarL/FixJ family response regulator